MWKFCKALDDTSGISGSLSIAELGVAFKDKNGSKWQDLGILLPATTPTNRALTRNENGWYYIATHWEKILAMQKRKRKSKK